VHFSHSHPLFDPAVDACCEITCHQPSTPLSRCGHPLPDFLAVDAPFFCYLRPDRHSFEGLICYHLTGLTSDFSFFCFGADTRYEIFQTVAPFFCLSRPASPIIHASLTFPCSFGVDCSWRWCVHFYFLCGYQSPRLFLWKISSRTPEFPHALHCSSR
jgi:hypothetical protein